MKTLQLIITLLLISAFGNAQNGINYKALIKDTNGNVLASAPISIQFIVYEGAALTNNVYQENHTINTDVNGFVIVNIGQGATGDDFSAITWGNDSHFLNVQVNTGSGLVDLGTTQFMVVPYALNALKSNDNYWTKTGTDIYTSNSEVGINSTNPEHTLDVRSSSQTEASQLNISTSDKSRYVRFFSGSDAFPDPSMTWAPGNNLLFATFDDNTLDFQERLRISSDGSIIAPALTNALIESGGDKALVTKEYVDIISPTGLEAIDEGNGIGWRLVGRDPANYGNIGLNALDLSVNDSGSDNYGATGINATALGFFTTALGDYSTAFGDITFAFGYGSTSMGSNSYADGDYSTVMGSSTYASGRYSTAMGKTTSASGDSSTSLGESTSASGDYSTAMGNQTQASSAYSAALGRYNVGGGDSISWVEDDPLFEIGNGTSNASKSNALTVLKNGTITAPSFDMSEITNDKALVTKEYMDANASVLEALNEGQGLGYRVRGRNPAYYGDIGLKAVDFSVSTYDTNPYGATGPYSTAMGTHTIASGNSSIAAGAQAIASGYASVAMGSYSKASGSVSTAFGVHTTAPSFAETVIGTYNKDYVPLREDIIDLNDRLFVIGNGTGPGSSQSNALTVLKNGNSGFVTTNPLAKIHISEGNDTGLGNNNGFLLLGEANGANISMDNNEIMARNNGNAADLNLQIEGGNVKIGGPVFIGDETIEDGGNNVIRINAGILPDVDNTNVLGNPSQRWTTVYATNGTINTSDRREKKNIKELTYGLAEVLQMQPVSFNWKNKNSPDLKLGLIAQELQTLIPEVVKTHTWETDEISGALTKKELERFGVYYSDLVPVLIKAIQEQQKIIDNEKAINAKQNSQLEVLLSRIEHIEAKQSN